MENEIMDLEQLASYLQRDARELPAAQCLRGRAGLHVVQPGCVERGAQPLREIPAIADQVEVVRFRAAVGEARERAERCIERGNLRDGSLAGRCVVSSRRAASRAA